MTRLEQIATITLRAVRLVARAFGRLPSEQEMLLLAQAAADYVDRDDPGVDGRTLH